MKRAREAVVVAVAVAGLAPGPGLSLRIIDFLYESLFWWTPEAKCRFVIFLVFQVQVQPTEVPQVSYSLQVPLKVRLPCLAPL